MAILSSRILGLIREMVFAGLFGAGRNLDAFLMAFRLPNLLRDLFAEGALSTAFITTFSKKIAVDGDASAWRLANKVATLTAVFMSAVTLLGIVFDSVFHLREEGWRKLTWRWALFFFVLAILNEIVWRTQTTDFWVSFKLFGVVPLTFLFAALQYPLLTKYSVESGNKG